MKHFLSVCAVIKNEAPYLAEWLEFHRLQGVEHFYLYDNMSTDNPKLTYSDVEVMHTSWNPVQFSAYNHCLGFFGDQTEWLAFIDADEFLVPSGKEEVESIPAFLELFEDYGALAVNWQIFGSNGHLTKPDGLVIENYTKRQDTLNPHVKA